MGHFYMSVDISAMFLAETASHLFVKMDVVWYVIDVKNRPKLREFDMQISTRREDYKVLLIRGLEVRFLHGSLL